MVPVRDRTTPNLIRVALLTEIPAPYRIPLFNALAARVDLRVIFLRERHPDRPYELHPDEISFQWQIVPGTNFTIRKHWVVLNRSVRRPLRHADVVILGGWNQPAFLEALLWSRAHRVPTILWSESTDRDNRSGRHEQFKRLLLPGIDAFLVPGTAARDYLRRLGVSAQRIEIAPNAVDPTIFGSAPRTRSDGICRVIAVARLSPEKGLDVLVRAVADLRVELVIAGTGPEEGRLRELAGPNVTFLGNVPRDELPSLYANADVAVVPSRSDTWGMVLNEAALAGLPIVATEAAGAAYDVLEHDGNGFRVPPDDVHALRVAVSRLIESPDLRARFAERSRELALRFTPEAWASATAALTQRVAE